MRNTVRRFQPFLLLILLTGCGLTGSWSVVAVDPPGVPFPLDYVTFDKDHRYTATWKQDGRQHTSVGAYRDRMFALDIVRDGSRPRTYRMKRRLDGSLRLIYEINGHKVSATLVRDDNNDRDRPRPHEDHAE